MGSTASRNAFAGYPYQEWVYRNLVFKMDLNKKIYKINAEIDTHLETNFDDIYLEDMEKNKFYIQVKNLKNFNIKTVKIENNIIKIKGQKNIKFIENETNIIILNSNFKCDTEILGIKAKLINSIYFIPLTHDNREKQIGMFYDSEREKNLDKLIEYRIHNRQLEFTITELPPLNVYPIKLNKRTILLRNIPSSDEIKKGVHWCIGEPGIGKSHLVKEFEVHLENLIIYRFHTDTTDPYKDDRLNYFSFLKDISYNLFKTPSFYNEEKIIKELEKSSIILIIDGLDHVENYKPSEFEKIIKFIEKLDNTTTLIFSRPLKLYSNFKKIIKIRKWNEEETLYYLNEEYDFKDSFEEIYKITDGYPIITYYLAEHLKHGGDLSDYSNPLDNIAEYYNKITENIRFKNSLKLFLTVPSYILKEEIQQLLSEDMSEILLDFINMYPYLFSTEMNRLHLFHDSLTNYLRADYKQNLKARKIIENSILSKNIEYLSRFNSIDFEDDFIKEVLILYSNFDTFKEISKNFDFESIKQFYISLKKIIPQYPDVLDVYQYYSLILITMILERHDYHNVPELFYNIFYYFDRNNIDEKKIFSNGVMWSLYVYYKTNDSYLYEKLLENEFYDKEEVLIELNEKWSEERRWSFSYTNNNLNETKIQEYLLETHEHELFEEYLAYIYINNVKESEYYTLINNYIHKTFKKHHEDYFNDICDEFGFIKYFKKNILKNARIMIYERGYLEDENIFLNYNLTEFMKIIPPNYSCDVYNYLIGYIRLYNHLNKNFIFEEIFKFLNMYVFRKDYSVVNLEKALLIFEKHNCIDECDSVRLIKNTMIKSEKGIRSLLDDYLNKKSPEFMLKIEPYWNELEIYINELDHRRINYIKMEHIAHDLRYVLSSNTDYESIKELLKSKYESQILNIIKLESMTIINVPEDSTQIFEENNIPFEIQEHEEKNEKRNYLLKTDLEKIKTKQIGYLKLSTCIDGFNHCLPFIEFFEIYNPKDLNKDCLKIIHNAISTKERYFNKYPASWYLCLGNMPYLLDMIDYNVNWNKLFNILSDYLKQSSIYLKNTVK